MGALSHLQIAIWTAMTTKGGEKNGWITLWTHSDISPTYCSGITRRPSKLDLSWPWKEEGVSLLHKTHWRRTRTNNLPALLPLFLLESKGFVHILLLLIPDFLQERYLILANLFLQHLPLLLLYLPHPKKICCSESKSSLNTFQVSCVSQYLVRPLCAEWCSTSVKTLSSTTLNSASTFA